MRFPQILFTLLTHAKSSRVASPEPKNTPNLPDSLSLKPSKHSIRLKERGRQILSPTVGSLLYPLTTLHLLFRQRPGRVERGEAAIWEHVCCTSKTCPLLGLPHFSSQGPRREGVGTSLDSKQMMTNGEQKSQTGVVGSLAILISETSNDTVGEAPRKGSAVGFSPGPEHPGLLEDRPLPAWARGEGGLPGGGTS